MQICAEPGCPALVEKGRCQAHRVSVRVQEPPTLGTSSSSEHTRVVVTGPPGSGKSTWVQTHARLGDLVWDLDDIAGVMAYAGELPAGMKGHLPWPVMKATLVMRDALVMWLSQTELRCSVFLIITDHVEAQHVASLIGATVQHGPLSGVSPDRWPRQLERRHYSGIPGVNYGRKWQREAKKFLVEHIWCVLCPEKPKHLATEVDHIIPHEGNYDLFWDRANWQSTCKPGHSRKTAKELATRGVR